MPSRSSIVLVVMLCAGIGFSRWCGDCSGQEATKETQPSAQPAHPFFAFCFDTHDAKKRDLEQQAAMLKQLGFDGAGHVGLDALAPRLESLDRAGLRLFLAGITVDLTKAPDEPLNQLKNVLPLLTDRDALLYVILTGYPSMDARGEEPGVKTLRAMADLAAQGKVRIGLYPHTSDWVARVDHAITVVNKVDRPHCGVIFNLCHFLRNEDPSTMAAVLRSAQPRLMAVTINGADLAGKSDPGWQRLIQPLDRGSFDVRGVLRELKQLNYRGPIGLMCYGIAGDSEEHLARSMARWRELCRDLE
jgi:sugar phosphate isomerase/epimerase